MVRHYTRFEDLRVLGLRGFGVWGTGVCGV